jgi:glucokinase
VSGKKSPPDRSRTLRRAFFPGHLNVPLLHGGPALVYADLMNSPPADRPPEPTRPSPGPLVLTLDAGGTNFVFNAIQDFKLVLPGGIVLPAMGHDLPKSLGNLASGFKQVLARTADRGPCVAASFAFPGPADYGAGIMGDLDNLPAYRGAVPLGRILREELGIPIFINNDGDLFAYGVALHGELRDLNQELARQGSPRRLTSLIGMTLGTGWGCGFAYGDEMFIGSSSTGLEIGACPYGDRRAIEETVSRTGIVRCFRDELERQGVRFTADAGDPRLPERIAHDARKGSDEPEARAARWAFDQFAAAFATGTNWAISLFDPDLVAVGGGLAGAWDVFFAQALSRLRSKHASGRPRLYKRVFDLGAAEEREAFLRSETDVMAGKKVGIVRTRLDTAEAIMLGAYRVALKKVAIG